jgi:pilus assembly protein CpaC
MRDGESFAIGGLLQDSARGSLKALPGAGEVPVLGTLFRSTQFQQDLTELVFIITPHLVKPMQTQNYPLPTDGFTTPDPLSLYSWATWKARAGLLRSRHRCLQLPRPPTAPAPVPSTPRSKTGPTTSVPTSPTPIGKLLDEPAPSAPAASPAPVATGGHGSPDRDQRHGLPRTTSVSRASRPPRSAWPRQGRWAATTSGTTGSN